VKVRCVRQFNARGEPITSSSWLTNGSVYHVLEVIHDREGLKFRILGEERATPALHRADQFEIVTDTIPTRWVVKFKANNFLKLSPREWLQENFWTRFFDGDQEARKVFEKTYRAILAEDS
jgi:hypothetical protein